MRRYQPRLCSNGGQLFNLPQRHMATNLREDSGMVSLGQSTEHPLFVQLTHGQFPLSSRAHLILSLVMGQPRSFEYWCTSSTSCTRRMN